MRLVQRTKSFCVCVLGFEVHDHGSNDLVRFEPWPSVEHESCRQSLDLVLMCRLCFSICVSHPSRMVWEAFWLENGREPQLQSLAICPASTDFILLLHSAMHAKLSHLRSVFASETSVLKRFLPERQR